MEIATLVSVLDHSHQAADYLHRWGLRDVHRAQRTLQELAETGLTLDLLASLCTQLTEHLPAASEPDNTLAAFARFLFAARSPLSLGALFDRDPTALPTLLAALSLGPANVDLLVEDPEAFDLLRLTEGQPISREQLLSEISAEASAFTDERQISAAIARVKRRHALRIAYGEMVLRHRLELVCEQLSHLAEASVETALRFAQQLALEQRPLPRRMDPARLRCAGIALGRLGAGEMDYASSLELLLAYDAQVEDAAQLRAVQDYFERVARFLVRLLAGNGQFATYQVELVSLPDSTASALAHSAEDVVFGYDSFGRTWHRQAMLAARAVAGNLPLGGEVLNRLQAWTFRRYLSPQDETGIQALKRRILLDAALHQDELQDPVTARGGLRDIEATVQFLQLLFGGDQPGVRRGGTLEAIASLELAGILTAEERTLLEGSYIALRRLQHRLQIEPGETDCTRSNGDAALHLEPTWRTLHKLLTSAFAEQPASPREVDLLLDPNPPEEEIRAALAPFGFAQPAEALATLQQLAQEQVPFLSTRRCRHLLAQILPRLLCAVAATPSPDATLDNLLRVGNSLGGKGVLWELFHWHPPTLQLNVQLCAGSPYLSNILTTNPGMMDELVDSLQLGQLPTLAELQRALAELCRGADDTLPILHDFKNAQHLRIGVRDLLGKEDIDQTHQALSDVAENCLQHVVTLEYERLVEKFGAPTIGPGPREGEPCRLVVLGLGKLGGREPNYHSPLEVAFLYEAEGTTRLATRSRRDQQTTNNHFFTQLAQRVLKQLGELTPKGRLYATEALLRPIGVGGALALSFDDFSQHFALGAAPLWQWQALCKARPVYGEAAARAAVNSLLEQLLTGRTWRDQDLAEGRALRLQLERGASPLNLKRGPGGTVDIEFLVQVLQLQQAHDCPRVLAANTQDALDRLAQAAVLPEGVARPLGDSYRFLRRVESGLRLLELPARHELPSDPRQLHALAFLIGHANPEKLRDQCLALMAENRAAFDQLLGPAA